MTEAEEEHSQSPRSCVVQEVQEALRNCKSIPFIQTYVKIEGDREKNDRRSNIVIHGLRIIVALYLRSVYDPIDTGTIEHTQLRKALTQLFIGVGLQESSTKNPVQEMMRVVVTKEKFVLHEETLKKVCIYYLKSNSIPQNVYDTISRWKDVVIHKSKRSTSIDSQPVNSGGKWKKRKPESHSKRKKSQSNRNPTGSNADNSKEKPTIPIESLRITGESGEYKTEGHNFNSPRIFNDYPPNDSYFFDDIDFDDDDNSSAKKKANVDAAMREQHSEHDVVPRGEDNTALSDEKPSASPIVSYENEYNEIIGTCREGFTAASQSQSASSATNTDVLFESRCDKVVRMTQGSDFVHHWLLSQNLQSWSEAEWSLDGLINPVTQMYYAHEAVHPLEDIKYTKQPRQVAMSPQKNQLRSSINENLTNEIDNLQGLQGKIGLKIEGLKEILDYKSKSNSIWQTITGSSDGGKRKRTLESPSKCEISQSTSPISSNDGAIDVQIELDKLQEAQEEIPGLIQGFKSMLVMGRTEDNKIGSPLNDFDTTFLDVSPSVYPWGARLRSTSTSLESYETISECLAKNATAEPKDRNSLDNWDTIISMKIEMSQQREEIDRLKDEHNRLKDAMCCKINEKTVYCEIEEKTDQDDFSIPFSINDLNNDYDDEEVEVPCCLNMKDWDLVNLFQYCLGLYEREAEKCVDNMCIDDCID